jgi:hypothetical protein
MIKKRYFTISKKGRYSSDEVLFRFENLDGAMSMFKYLMEGKAIDLDHEDVPDNTQTPDEDGYVSSIYLYIEKGEPEYHLGSEIIEVYTKEEFDKIKKEREEWKLTFKKKGKK